MDCKVWVKAREKYGKGADCKEEVKQKKSAGKDKNCKIYVKRQRSFGKEDFYENGVKRRQNSGKAKFGKDSVKRQEKRRQSATASVGEQRRGAASGGQVAPARRKPATAGKRATICGHPTGNPRANASR